MHYTPQLASRQWKILEAWVNEVGSGSAKETDMERRHLGLKIPDLDRVCILWVLEEGTGIVVAGIIEEPRSRPLERDPKWVGLPCRETGVGGAEEGVSGAELGWVATREEVFREVSGKETTRSRGGQGLGVVLARGDTGVTLVGGHTCAGEGTYAGPRGR